MNSIVVGFGFCFEDDHLQHGVHARLGGSLAGCPGLCGTILEYFFLGVCLSAYPGLHRLCQSCCRISCLFLSEIADLNF